MRWRDLLRPTGLDDVLGMNRRNIAYVIPRNPRALFPIADDKVRCKRVLEAAGVATPETLALFSTFHELEAVEARLEAFDECVIKPARGAGGRGILVLERHSNGWRTPSGRTLDTAALRRHIGDIVFGVYTLDRPDVALVERRLRPHPFFAELYPRGLSDIRVMVVDRRPVLAMIRVPTDASDGRANLHQGGLGLGLDLDTGRITRSWLLGREVTQHPDTGVATNGRTVPGWDRIVECATAVGQAVDLGYLGVDLVLSEDGHPLVLEINVRPGLEIQNVTGVPLRARLAALGIVELER